MSFANVFKLPCGFGPPGQLPAPAASGVDGGRVLVPGEPPSFQHNFGIEFLPVPGPPLPGVPSGPFFPPQPPVIPGGVIVTSITVTPGLTSVLISIGVNQDVTASCGITPQPGIPPASPSGYDITTPASLFNFVFDNLLPDTSYNFYVRLARAGFSVLIPGLFRTQQETVIQVPQIINPVATFNQGAITVSWSTVFNSVLTNTIGIVEVYLDSGLLVQQTLPTITSNHSVTLQNIPFDEDITVNIISQIPSQGVINTFLSIPATPSVNLGTVTPTSTDSEVSFTWNAVTSFNSPALVNIQAQLISDEGLTVGSFTSVTEASNGQVTFTGLPPNTPYIIDILIFNSQDSDSRQIGVATQAPPIVFSPFGTSSISGEPGTGVVTELGSLLPTLQNYSNIAYGSFLNNTAYNTGEIDLKYTPYTIQPTGFLPTFNDLGGIFNNIVHYSILNVLKQNATTFEIANLDKNNITEAHLLNSLAPNIRKVLTSLKYSNGVKIPQQVVLRALKRALLSYRINDIDIDFITKELVKLSSDAPSVSTTSVLPLKKEYGVNQTAIKDSRKITPLSPISVEERVNYTKALNILNSRLLSLSNSEYADDTKEYLKLWYFIPSDVNKLVRYLDASGVEQTYTVANDNSIATNTSTLYLVNNDYFNYTSSASEVVVYEAEFAKSRLVTLRNSDDHLVKHLLGVEDEILFEASAIDTNIELTTSAAYEIDSHYVFTLNPLSLEETYSDKSPFIITTKATYTLQTKAASAVSAINDLVAYSTYPWLTLTVDYDDPIFEYFEVTNAQSNKFSVTFKDLTFNNYSGKNSADTKILPRKIPRYILVIPTDKFKYNPLFGKSYLADINVRQLRFVHSLDPNTEVVGLQSTPIKVENTFINSSGEDKTGGFSTQSYKGSYSTSNEFYSYTFKDESKKRNRTVSPLRKFITITRSLVDNFNIDSGVTFYDVYSRLERKSLYGLDGEAEPKVTQKIKVGAVSGTPLLHVPGPKTGATARPSSTRLLSLKDEGTDEYKRQYIEVDIDSFIQSTIQRKVNLSSRPAEEGLDA
jgi:hypothetical protein